MDLTPKPVDPKLYDSDEMRRRMEDRMHRKSEIVHLPTSLRDTQVTKDGVPTDGIVQFYEHHEGVVTELDRGAVGFTYNGDLYADKTKALEAAKDYWMARKNECLVKIRAICKELGLTG